MAPPLTLDQLLASFPDNTTGQIKPLNMRDFVQSLELKYDNYTVVKPSQVNGNKFPDPGLDDRIHLTDSSYWLINGDVTILNPISYGNGVLISGLAGSFGLDSLRLDPTAGAVTMFEPDVSGASLSLEALSVDIGAFSGGTATGFSTGAFNDDSVIITITSCSIGAGDLGSLENVNSFLMDDSFLISVTSPLFFVGTLNLFLFSGNRASSGGLFGIQSNGLDFTACTVADAQIVENAYQAGGTQDLIVVSDDNTFAFGQISNNSLTGAGSGKFISGNSAQDAINTTFRANVGIENTRENGALVMAGNAVVTPNPGANLWTPIDGNNLDVLNSGAQRFIRSNPLELEYIGKTPLAGDLVLSCSLRRAVGGGDVDYSISIFVNGVIINESGVEVSQSAFTDGSKFQSVTVAIPINLQPNDVIVPVIRGDGNGNASLVQNLQLVAR